MVSLNEKGSQSLWWILVWGRGGGWRWTNCGQPECSASPVDPGYRNIGSHVFPNPQGSLQIRRWLFTYSEIVDKDVDIVFQNQPNFWSFRKITELSFFKNEQKKTTTNDLKSFQRSWKNYRFFTDIFSSKLLGKRSFYWKNNFTEISFSEKTNEIDENWLIILRTNKINF